MADQSDTCRSYLIPTDSGCFDPGHRVINWLWYCNVDEESTEMNDILTDVDGHRHKQTVPGGRVQLEVWARYRDKLLPHMTRPYAELFRATAGPFVTKVTDTMSDESLFCDGRVVLAGDAYAAMRPHLAAATDHAAWQCLSMMDLWTSVLSSQQWNSLLKDTSTQLWLRSRLLGYFGQGRWLDFFRTIWSLLSPWSHGI